MSAHTILGGGVRARGLRHRAPGARAVAGPGVAAVVIAAAAAALTYLATRRGMVLGLGGAIGVIGVVWFAGTRRTQLALAVLMVYLGALDGVLKLTTGSSAVTFVRDLLLYALVVGLLVRAIATRRALPAPPLSGWILSFAALVLIQLFNPQDGTLTHSLAGIRQNLEFVPLFYLTFAFLRTRRALRIFLIVLALLGAANGVADVVQSRLSPQQLAAWGPGYAERVLGTSQFSLGGRTFYDASGQQHTRPFGLMSDAGTGGLVGALSLGAIIALATLGRRRRDLLLAGLVVVPVIAGIITSQGRAVLVTTVVVTLTYAAMTASSRRRVVTLFVVAGIAAIAIAVVGDVLAGSANRYSGLNASRFLQTTSQARGSSFATIPTNLVQHPFGSGLGTGGPAAGQAGAPAAARTADAENEISFATLEAGIPGMVALIGFTALIFWVGVKGCRVEADSELRLLLAAIVAPIAGILALYTVSAVSPTSPCGPYLWAAGGIVAYWLIARPAAERPRAVAPARDSDGSALPPHEPSISVVIATRDRAELLRRVTAQLVAQLGPADELIVVDDSAEPGTGYPWLTPRARLEHSFGQGPAVARNLGWRSASGEIIAFTDDDVTLDPGWLAAIRTALADRALVAVEGQTVSRAFDPLFEYSVRSDSARNGLTCNVAYRREALLRLEGFDEGFRVAHCEDVDLFLRARQLGPVAFAPAMRVEHEPRAAAPSQLGARGGWLDSERRLYAKHPELSPRGLPPTAGAAVAYAVWPFHALFAPDGATLRRQPRRLLRALAISLVWWSSAARALGPAVIDDLRGTVDGGLNRRAVAAGLAIARRMPLGLLRWINQSLHRSATGRRVLGVVAARMAEQTVVITQGRLAGFRFAPGGGQPAYALGASEPDLQDALATLVRPGDVVYDIGANVGFFTLLCARLATPAGQVYAFEPMTDSAGALRRNLALNDIEHVEVVVSALSDRPGTVYMAAGNNSATAHLAADATEGIAVPCTTVDAFVASGHRAPTVIKIDVEGAEDLVLAGMRETLRRDRPAILCELHSEPSDHRRAAIGAMLEDAGYAQRLLDIGNGAMPHLLALPRDAQATGVPASSLYTAR